MNKKSKSALFTGVVFLVLFIAFTAAVKSYDVKPIGPLNSKVGFAGINGKVFDTIGQSDFWYDFSEKLGYMALLVCVCFAIAGVVQLIKGKGFKGVDRKIIALGVFYIVVISLYVAFDKIAINYRTVLEADGTLEASYPSSHSMLAVCVFVTMLMQDAFNRKKTTGEKAGNVIAGTLLVGLMLVSRLLAGVHWFTDIVGSVLISVALISFYKAVIARWEE